ncbi:hypothetical protein GLYMA_04G182800v4 [Glycine max]|uniref:Uncharacterized protein n=1 Tax=Glycine max TaxID=3847 RepID=K7KKX3_SOYBN|nr:hypothetical protein GYH30_010342 [Glycine max]KRH63527.1 hypothetical protein GLYMA_04G182800v4 [Glycine max]
MVRKQDWKAKMRGIYNRGYRKEKLVMCQFLCKSITYFLLFLLLFCLGFLGMNTTWQCCWTGLVTL